MTIIIHEINDNNLMTPTNMDTIWEIFSETVNNVSIKYDGETYKFEDICERPYPSYDTCTSQQSGFFSLFGFNSIVWSTPSSIQTQLDTFSSVLNVCLVVLFFCCVFCICK